MTRPALLAALPLVFIAACSGPPLQVTGKPTAVPAALQPDAAEQPLQTLHARGVQIYACRAKAGDPTGTEWAFVAPQAQLFDAQGRAAGTHGAGPHWEGTDGSRVTGTVKSRADAPLPGAVPWLLLTTRAQGPAGAFSRVTSIQRINTVGGVAPPAVECSTAALGREVRVTYSADYALFGSR